MLPGLRFDTINVTNCMKSKWPLESNKNTNKKTELSKKRRLDFMKFVTRMVSKSHLANKFHEIKVAVRKQREHQQEDKT